MGVVHNVSAAIGRATQSVHAGDQKLAESDSRLASRRRIAIQSSAFQPGALPVESSADGGDVSPALQWSGVPAETRELVLLCEDPDAPMPKAFVHWVVYGIAPSAQSLPRALNTEPATSGVKQGRNSMRRVGFAGAAPPPGHGVHHYHFQLFALDQPLHLGAMPDRDDVVNAMAGHVIASGDLVGTFERH